MASVKRFPGSKKWYACYKIPTSKIDAGGRPVFKRVQRSTGTLDKGRALQLAISYERAARMVAEKTWNEHSAHQFLVEIKAISGVQVAQVEQTDKFLMHWLEAKKKTVAEKTWANFSGVILDFIEWLGVRNHSPLVEITPRLVAEFRDAEMALGKAGTTVNKALAILGQAFEEAVSQMALERNPAKGLRIKKADKKAQKRTAFTFEQFRELVRRTGPGEKSTRGNEVNPDWQTFILATGYTGGRQQEVAQLEWANIDLTNRLIGLKRTKNGDVHWMPMHPALFKHITEKKAALAKKPEYFLMPYMAALKERVVSKIFREVILPRVGIRQPYAERTEEKGVGRRLAAYSIHSLRHSLSTWLNAAGVSEMMRMRIVGHEDEEVSREYTHTELVQAAAELSKIPSI